MLFSIEPKTFTNVILSFASFKTLQLEVSIESKLEYWPLLTGNTSIQVSNCADYICAMIPFINLAPSYIETSLIASLKRKGFAIEYTDDYYTAYLLLDEPIDTEEFYWKDLYKVKD